MSGLVIISSLALALSADANETPEKLRYLFSRQPSLLEQIQYRQKDTREQYTTEEEYLKELEKQVEFASVATGVRKEFLMGMLVVESNLGRNTGRCTYQEVRDDAKKDYEREVLSEGAWKAFERREKVMKGLAQDLGRDYGEMTVSCNPPYNGTGGAMGIPQFMPDTWIEYEDRIASLSGTISPDPWSIRDGVIAMALKVSDVPGVVDHNIYAERRASKMYLSGTTSGRYEWYASKIQYWSKHYEKMMS